MIYETRRKKELVEYYMKEEADAKGLVYVHWKKASAPGQWLLCDDGCVIRCKDVREYKIKRSRKPNRLVYTGVCYRNVTDKTMLPLEHMRIHTYGLIPIPWWQRFIKKYPMAVPLLTLAVFEGRLSMTRFRWTYRSGKGKYLYHKEDWDVFEQVAQEVFKGDRHLSKFNVKMIYSIDGVRDMINQNLAELIKERGITAPAVLDIMGEALALARSKGSAKDLLAVADRYATILAMPHTLRAAQSAINSKPQLSAPSDEEADRMYDSILNKQPMEDAIVTDIQ